MGRHSRADELDEDSPVYAAAAFSAAPARPPKTSAVADLQLVLHNPRLLLACLAVAIAPFACYFAVILQLHKMHIWAIFLGAPLVLAGVLVGAVLDRAYARLARGPREVKARASAALAEPGLRSVEGARP